VDGLSAIELIMTKISRRDFLILTSRASALAFMPWPKSLPGNPAARQQLPSVSVAEGTNEDTPAQILQTALQGLGGLERFIKTGQTVAIKPNATWAYPPKTASSTDPDFLTAVIQAVQAAGAGRIIVMDHCSIEPGADDALRINGIGQLVKDLGIDYVFPDRFNAPASTYTKIDLPQGKANQSIRVIKAAVEADVRINLAVAKTHNVAKFSMCLKHMMGFLQQPGLLHSNLEQGIADLSTPSSMQAQLHILEAIRVRIPFGSFPTCAGPETDITNPLMVARRNKVIAGVDPVLVDAFGCVDLFDIQPQDLTHVLRASESGCGDMDVDAALADGRIRRFKVGAPVMDATAAATITTNNSAASPATPNSAVTPVLSKPTAIILPPSEPVVKPVGSSGLSGENCSPTERIISLKPLLNLTLIPAAAAITGVGLAILTRMRRKLPGKNAQSGDLPEKPGTATEDRHHD
jgi:uncharacterized protein (DUF362 family)